MRMVESPAGQRIEWILAGLAGAPGWGSDAAQVLAPELAALVPADVYVERVRRRSTEYAPVTIVGADIAEHFARVRLRRTDGEIDVLTCSVESEPPHRITATGLQGFVPSGLRARLPADFADYPLATPPAGPEALQSNGKPAQALVVFAGVPGSGKSTLADAVGRELGVPVFATDWVLGALTPFGGRHLSDLLGIGEELLVTLALRQLELGQSAILDAPVEDPSSRARLESLAGQAKVAYRVIVCTCSDPAIHRARLEGRSRGIPGWHDAGNWDNVARRLKAFPAWEGEHLTVDTAQPYDQTLAAALRYIATR